jgi:DNA repair exonuclease SbcCD ATPase subunit
MSVTCLEKMCTVTDIVEGKRRDVRRLSAGHAAIVSLSTQSAIGLPE